MHNKLEPGESPEGSLTGFLANKSALHAVKPCAQQKIGLIAYTCIIALHFLDATVYPAYKHANPAQKLSNAIACLCAKD